MNVPRVGPHHVQQWLKAGTDHDAVVQMLVASGAWTEDGAHDIVQTFSAQELQPEPIEQLGLAGPTRGGTTPLHIAIWRPGDAHLRNRGQRRRRPRAR